MSETCGSRRKLIRILVAIATAVAAVIVGAVVNAGSEPAPLSAPTARGLTCGTFEFPSCQEPDDQFDAAFDPGTTDGFGGGTCEVTRTPVVFIHGNADRSVNWDSAITGPVGTSPPPKDSVYDEFVSNGYTGCELFGVTFLSEAEQRDPQLNYHRPDKYRMIIDFIDRVKASTGAPQVDIVAHSLGVSMTMAALTWHDETSSDPSGDPGGWDGVRRFVNIAGGIHGLGACNVVGFANPLVPTCGSQNLMDPYVFGFYQDNGSGIGSNGWTAATGPRSLRTMPAAHPDVDFYTIHAGAHDEVHCSRPAEQTAACSRGAMFEPAPNVRAQLNVGTGATAGQVDLDLTDGSLYTARGGDLDGVGHFKAKNNTGEITVEMLTSDCTGTACRGTYNGGPVTTD